MFENMLDFIKKHKLSREIKDRDFSQGAHIKINGRGYINFSSNDYLGLSNNEHLVKAAEQSLRKYGFGSGASRLLSGGSSIFKELEKNIAEFKSTQAALIFNSGYAANTGIIPAISDEKDMIFSDELNHASIVDGFRLSRAAKYIYKHKDINELEDALKKSNAAKKIVITDSVFSMDGDIAPIADIYKICKKNDAILYIDDAHATGVLGSGRGSLKHFNIKPEPWIIQMGTFSKAMGSFGAFAAGDKDMIDLLVNSARSFIFSTALPSCVIAASIAALEIIQKEPERISRLWDNRDKAAREIESLGYDISCSETPIIPLRFNNVEDALQKAKDLFDKNILAPAIRPPTVREPIIRITVTAAHNNEDIEALIKALSL